MGAFRAYDGLGKAGLSGHLGRVAPCRNPSECDVFLAVCCHNLPLSKRYNQVQPVFRIFLTCSFLKSWSEILNFASNHSAHVHFPLGVNLFCSFHIDLAAVSLRASWFFWISALEGLKGLAPCPLVRVTGFPRSGDMVLDVSRGTSEGTAADSVAIGRPI